MSVHTSLLPPSTPRSAFAKLLEYETKMAWRLPVGLLFGVAMPVVALIIIGAIPATREPAAVLGGLSYFSVYFPILTAFVVAALSLVSLPGHLVNYRELGILRRISTTPVPPSWMLGAQLIVNLALCVVTLGILIVAGMVGFDLAAPGAPGGFVLSLLLGVAAVFAVGLWVSAIARTTGGALVIGQLLFYPLLFSAGLWVPQERMPSWLRDISQALPLGAMVHALQDSMQGTFPAVESLLVMVGWAVLFGYLAVRFFKWE